MEFMAVGWWSMLICKDKVYVFRLLECVVVGWCHRPSITRPGIGLVLLRNSRDDFF